MVGTGNNLKSLLFVPAKEKMLSKIKTLNADGYILDLEDSIEECEKENALNRIIKFLETDDGQQHFFVRINFENMSDELRALHRFPELGFMIPKVENSLGDCECREILMKHPAIALVETPVGVVNIKEIVTSNWVDFLAFGAEDYTSKTNMKNSLEDLFYVKSRLVLYAKAYQKRIYDSPSFQINKKEEFEKELQLAMDMGFDGKLAITPKHVEEINERFKGNDIQWMKELIRRYEELQQAVAVIDGVVYEKMHIDRMRKKVAEYERD